MRCKKLSSDKAYISKEQKVNLKTAGKYREIVALQKKNKKCRVKNISRDEYVDLNTGEIHQKKKSENRYQTPKGVRKSINRLRDLIYANATDIRKCKFITLTYAEVMNDHTQVYKDGKAFDRKLKTYLNKQKGLTIGQKTYKRIIIAEPQGENNGYSWHMHIILFFDDEAPYIDNKDTQNLWSKGLTSTKRVYNVEGLVNYFRYHLSDLEYEGDCTDGVIVEREVQGTTKKYLKGERLKLYPTGMRLFTPSKGMKRPQIEEMTNQEAEEIVKDDKFLYRETYEIRTDTGIFINKIDKRHYKTMSANIENEHKDV